MTPKTLMPRHHTMGELGGASVRRRNPNLGRLEAIRAAHGVTSSRSGVETVLGAKNRVVGPDEKKNTS